MRTPPVPHGAVVVGVEDSRADEQAARAWATAAATRERRPLVVAHDHQPARALAAMSERAHLVVVGNGRHGTTTALVRRSRCPVVVVPDPATASPGHGVVVGVGGIPDSVTTLEFAFHTASWLAEPLTVVHCFWEAEHASGHSLASPPHSDLAEERLLVAEALAGLRQKYPEVDARVRIERGLPEDVLADLAPDAALVVVGETTHGLLADLALGSVARSLLAHASSPVAVVPRPRAAAPVTC